MYKILFLLLITTQFIYGSVSATVDAKSVELGDMVTYSLHISGEDISRPNIQKLCDVDVISTNSQTSIKMVNGEYSRSFILSYKFLPQKSCDIDPMEVEVDGKKLFSNAVSLEVKPISSTKSLDYSLTLSAQKKELFVGETFDVVLVFKQKVNSSAVDSEFVPPKIKGFWIKNESKPIQEQKDGFVVTKIIYTMAPQREGNLTISRAQMKIATRSVNSDSWGAWIPTIKWKSYFSNELEVDVKPLPQGISLVGDFTINATTDKTTPNAGEAINLKLEVLGSGNLEDIKSFKPQIDGVSIFDEKIVIDGTKLNQNLTFVSDRDFVIPSFSLNYFDPKLKEVRTVSTKEIPISVKNAKAKEVLNIKKQESKSQVESSLHVEAFHADAFILVIVFLVGIASGILLMIFKKKINFKREQKSSIKDPKTLLVKLLEYKNDEQVKEIIEILEKNLYSNQKVELDKKVLKEILSRYKIV